MPDFFTQPDWEQRAFYLAHYDGWSLKRIADELHHSLTEVQEVVRQQKSESDMRHAETIRDMNEVFQKDEKK